ncbi:centromere protein R [Ambystoma mexicanum]|uniref:centromere protein R n=1 Tax=Ambystoma mexicanum TaxID=8296 RepID=UPI0037E84338
MEQGEVRAVPRVKRSLAFDASKSKEEATPRQKQLLGEMFSPTTGTRQLSPLQSPRRKIERQRKLQPYDAGGQLNPLESRLDSREQTLKIKMDKFMVLHSRAEQSMETFLKTRKSLTSLQALEGSREHESLLGVSDRSSDLKAELQKTKELMLELNKRKLLRLTNTKHQ